MRTIAILSVSLIFVGCAIPRVEKRSVDAQSDTQSRLVELRREEICEMHEEVVTLHKSLMIIGKSDEAYCTKLEAAQRMPPDTRVLGDLPSELARLDAIKAQLEKKIKRYSDLLTIGNAGY